LAATGQDVFHQDFLPLTDGFLYADPTDAEGLINLVNEYKIAAIMFEAVQGEGGVLPLPAVFVETMVKLAKEKDILLIVDEVQTGNGRSGKLYAYQNFGIQPDLVSTAKGLGGGLPLGGALVGEKVESVLGFGDHGSTFGGNPVCCAGAVSIIERMDDAFLAEVQKKSEYVFRTLSDSKGIRSVSGMGLMIGIETERDVKEVLSACMERGVLCLTAKNKLRLLPALNISWEILEEAISVIKEVCAE
jgi:acetylornithine/N-succinyldiaminopimelate aminotransferase